MAYCLNCDYSQNLDSYRYCSKCGSLLALRGRFNILNQIGQGGFGKTYLAEDLDNRKKRCVVKQLVYQGTSTHAVQEAQRLFEQEAERLDQLSPHPQIPKLLAYFEDDRYLYLVQEFIEGHDLDYELMKYGTFSEAKIWEILEELLPILKFVHEHKVIHRDLKPENVMRRECDRKLILIDFGVAKLLAESSTVQKGGTVVGTFGYASPEQMRGKVSPASDLFGLGMICFRLLTHQDIPQLFQDYDYGWVEQWQEHVNGAISQRLEQVLDRLLKLNLKDRYLTADDVLNDLNDRKTNERYVQSAPVNPFMGQPRLAKTSLNGHASWFSHSIVKVLIPFGVLAGIGAVLGFTLRPGPKTVKPSTELFQGSSQVVVESPSQQDEVESFTQVNQVPSGIFNYGGSTTWAPIRKSVDLEIQTARPEFRLRYLPPEDVPPSSQAGLDMLLQGKLDFSLASRLPSNELLEDLKAQGMNIRLVPVAENFDVAAVHRSLSVDQLTIDQLNAIFEGKILNWREVGGPDLEIIRLDRDVNENFTDTRPNLESDNIKLFTTPADAVDSAPNFPGGIYVHTAAMLVPHCAMKTLSLVNESGETIVPYKQPLVPEEQCEIQKNKVNLAELGSDQYPRQLRDTLYVVINENGGIEQQVGQAYAKFLLSQEGQTLLEKAGYRGIQR